jgi:hypothetical protein
MAYIPEDSQWYLADIVIEYVIAQALSNVVLVNTILIEASSPESALQKSLEHGHAEEREYLNTDGQTVKVIFQGLRDLNVIHDPLQNGAELAYEWHEGLSEVEIQKLTSPNEELGVFGPRITHENGPNIVPRRAMRLLEDMGLNKEDLLPDSPTQ